MAKNAVRIIRIFFIFFLLPLYGFAETIKAPELTPALTNQHEQATIDEGIALQNQGKHDEAVLKFKQVLEKSPTNVLAIYEMASSYFSAKKYDEALKASYNGARFKSRYLGKFYLMIGNSLDEMGRPNEAISAFRDAVSVVSDDALIHFNLAVILVNAGKPAEAQPHLEKAVELNPQHSSSHYALSRVYFDQNKRIPGILAILRFLSLEPESKRSQKAVATLDENLGNADSKKVTIDQRITLLNDLFKTMVGADVGKFVKDHYFPYFVELQKNNLVTPFTNYIYQGSNPEAAAWIEQHDKEIAAFVKWSKDFSD